MGITLPVSDGQTPGNYQTDMTPTASVDDISFSIDSCLCCVGIIDIVNSTRITASLCRDKMKKYYGLFLNSVAPVVRAYGGVVIKNVGDALLYYFPSADDLSANDAILRCLDCGSGLAGIRPNLNKMFSAELLPDLSYRISMDYGEITLARAFGSPREDIFGPTVNVCAKMKSIAEPNTVVVGGDLYQVSRGLGNYRFMEMRDSISIGIRPYPVYALART